MGLSASSLRLAMLTARKSNLEFEAQQINQQRMNLSNQSAAIYNDMLSMSVPTPPNANEFTKEVYTFNKGNGVSQLLSTTRNSSGPYGYDILYKTPKTEDVLMKKQLNNVGFKYNNDQMTANIDGVDYALTLNGNEDKLNDYIKTQKTYENIKNVESQMQSLWSLSPDKELSASQMKQYFETLGLSTYEEPTRTQVLDVETMDDAFQNVYYSGHDYSEENVEFTYDSDTPPIELDLSQKTLLKTDNGTLTQGEDNKHYTYTVKANSDDKNSSELNYIITENESGAWEWTLENITKDSLEETGIKVGQSETYLYSGKEYEDIDMLLSKNQTIYDGNKMYTNIKKCDDGWSWNEIEKINLEEGVPTEINKIMYTPIKGEDNIWYFETSRTDVILENDLTEFFKEEEVKTETYRISDEIASFYIEPIESWGGRLEISKDDENGNYVGSIGDCDFTYSVDKNAILTVSSNNYFGKEKIQEQGLTKEQFRDISGYWYNRKSHDVAIVSQSLVTDRDATYFEDGEWHRYQDEQAWVYVIYDSSESMWQYQIQLTDNDVYTYDSGSYKEGSGIITKSNDTSHKEVCSGYKYNNNEYEMQEDGIYARDVDKNKDGNIDYTEILYKEGEQWKLKQRYSAGQLGIRVSENIIIIETQQSGDELPSVISVISNVTLTDLNNDQYKFEEGKINNFKFNSRNCTIIENDDGTFTLSGSGLPEGVAPVTDDDPQNYSGSSTSNNITFKVTYNGANSSQKYSITATFKAWVTGNQDTWGIDDKQDGYSYDTKNHTVSLTTPVGVTAQILLRNQNNERDKDDKNITVNEMLAFYEAILEQFEFFGTSTAYKTKLDTARENYISTIDAKGVETPGENEVIYNFIDQNGNEAYLYVPLSCVNTNGQIDSTYAYMLETSYIEGQTETISQKANIIYDENGRIAKICFDDGTVVMPEITVEQDDEAYEAAMVKYDYERAKYEKALSDCNTKTQIIQEQDKKLELQLKSIDTEHTAIQTELEAVKKVLDSNIKSSFGTFNA